MQISQEDSAINTNSTFWHKKLIIWINKFIYIHPFVFSLDLWRYIFFILKGVQLINKIYAKLFCANFSKFIF